MKKLREIFGISSSGKKKPAPITEPFTMVSELDVTKVCGDFELQPEAQSLLEGNPAPHAFVNQLNQAEIYADAIRYLCYALPKRSAIWWAALCVRSVPPCFNDDLAREALQAGEAWVTDPSDHNANAALSVGKKHSFEMPTAPAAWVAMAAGWSGEKAVSEDLSIRPECLSAHAASGAILLTAVSEEDQAPERHRTFLETGVLIAQGKRQP